MFLKALTLRGFKSFADKTVLEFEPGVMIVVGPNGSGKSNLVDAVAWVLGAQGPRTLRGGKMDDVIFAGTPDRPALGRAEVSLTIDNTASLLPIEFSEVTITRTLFRTGDSEYAINGAPCRLLDIQELLSDTGIGRQQHVIVGQGQLDAVLNARPEDRRAIVEEAAGVLKYRKRREKAERRLEATEGNLLRLNDLLREVRRGLTPLQKQADAARRHDGLVAELRAIRLYLAGHELAGLQAKAERLRDRASELSRDEGEVQARLRALDLSVLEAEQALTAAGHGDVADALARVEGMRERGRGLQALVHERRRGLDRELLAAADEGVVETLVADAGALRRELAAVDDSEHALMEREHEVERQEAELARERAALPRIDDQQPDAVALLHELSLRRDAVARGTAELDRIETRMRAAEERAARVAAERIALVEALTVAERAVGDADAVTVRQQEARGAMERALDAADDQRRNAEADSSRWHARAEALALDTARTDTGTTAIADLPGYVGPLVDHLGIESGTDVAVAVALGELLRAVVVEGGDAARGACERLSEGDAGALVLVLEGRDEPVTTGATLAPQGSRPLAACLSSRTPGLHATLTRFLGGVVLADGGWRDALDLALDHPDLTVVTRDGDRFGGRGPWRVGVGGPAGATQAALDEAEEAAQRADSVVVEAVAALTAARDALAVARDAEAAALSGARQTLSERDATQTALAHLDREHAERVAETAQLADDHTMLRDAYAADEVRIVELAAALPAAEAAAAEAQNRTDLAAEARAAHEQRVAAVAMLRRDFELQSATVEERRAVLSRRLGEVEERLARDPEAKLAAERSRAALVDRQRAYAEVTERLEAHAVRAEAVLERMRERRRRQAEAASQAGGRLEELRTERADLERRLTELREHQQRRGADDAETRTRLEAIVERIRTEFDCEPGLALDTPAPQVPEGTTFAGRARDLDRELRIMGPINPLALEEYEALQERHAFLQDQLEDVKSTRRELHRVIRAVDREIVTIFEAAFTDVQENFAQLFTTLFPGGSGRVFLTDPDDLLQTGIEMEARPSGKNTKRLSLLSGGERSLTALAFLFGVFRARPSPFYLLDEVEAALDDVNLHRFLDLVHEFRGEAQLVIVSHQKRTMEAADCLYGISMPPGGSSRVVSQRIRGEIDLRDVDADALPTL